MYMVSLRYGTLVVQSESEGGICAYISQMQTKQDKTSLRTDLLPTSCAATSKCYMVQHDARVQQNANTAVTKVTVFAGQSSPRLIHCVAIKEILHLGLKAYQSTLTNSRSAFTQHSYLGVIN